MNLSKHIGFNTDNITVGNSFMPKHNIDISCSDPTYLVTINGVVPSPPHAPSDPLILHISLEVVDPVTGNNVLITPNDIIVTSITNNTDVDIDADSITLTNKTTLEEVKINTQQITLIDPAQAFNTNLNDLFYKVGNASYWTQIQTAYMEMRDTFMRAPDVLYSTYTPYMNKVIDEFTNNETTQSNSAFIATNTVSGIITTITPADIVITNPITLDSCHIEPNSILMGDVLTTANLTDTKLEINDGVTTDNMLLTKDDLVFNDGLSKSFMTAFLRHESEYRYQKLITFPAGGGTLGLTYLFKWDDIVFKTFIQDIDTGLALTALTSLGDFHELCMDCTLTFVIDTTGNSGWCPTVGTSLNGYHNLKVAIHGIGDQVPVLAGSMSQIIPSTVLYNVGPSALPIFRKTNVLLTPHAYFSLEMPTTIGAPAGTSYVNISLKRSSCNFHYLNFL